MGFLLYELFNSCPYEIVKSKEKTMYWEKYCCDKENLLKQLNKDQQKEFKNLLWNLNMHYEEINFDTIQKAICFGIKLGMEIQEFTTQLE